MSEETFLPGPTTGTVRNARGEVLAVPAGWAHVPPGDPALTRRLKAAGPHWIVQERRGRKIFSRGVWAPAETVERLREELAAERSTEQYARKRQAGATRRAAEQQEYVSEFGDAVRAFLRFAPCHAALADQLARVVTEHATPVGSGTVARTQRIPIERRAEAAVIAWMRHQTTGYDDMRIARIKGERRAVRRELAERSRALLSRYRQGLAIPANCPLAAALARPSSSPSASAQQDMDLDLDADEE